MTARTRTARRAFVVWVAVALGLLALEYKTTLQTDFGPVGADTNPYRGPVWWALGTLAPATLLPLEPIARHAILTNGTGWTGKVMRLLPRFHNYHADSLVFAVANSALWLLATAVFSAVLRRATRSLGFGHFRAWVVMIVLLGAVGGAVVSVCAGFALHVPLRRLLLPYGFVVMFALVYPLLVCWIQPNVDQPGTRGLRFGVANSVVLLGLESALLFCAVRLGVLSWTEASRAYIPAAALYSIVVSALSYSAARGMAIRRESSPDGRTDLALS
jgi:hypothetical protein